LTRIPKACQSSQSCQSKKDILIFATSLTHQIEKMQNIVRQTTCDSANLEHEMQYHAATLVKIHVGAIVSSCIGQDPYTIYSMTVSCQVTKTWWIVKKRFSKFFQLRQTLLKVMKSWKSNPSCKEAKMILQGALKLKFPIRRLILDTENIMNERKRDLKAFLKALIEVRAACFIYLWQQKSTNIELLTALNDIYTLLDTFLEVPETRHEQEIRLSVAVPSSETSLLTEKVNNNNQWTMEPCSICLCEISVDDQVVMKLACSHFFHSECLTEWFDRSASCPLCRKGAMSGLIVQSTI